MKSVCICGSTRFRPEIREFAARLKKLGVIVFEPTLQEIKQREWDRLPRETQEAFALGRSYDHFQKIRQADLVYIFNEDGYMGNSCTLELGYAVALGKIIYAKSEDPDEICRNVLFREIIASPEELFTRLQ